MNLKRRSPKIFVSRLFSKFMPSYPTLMGCLRFRFIRALGPWTPLTSKPSSALSAVLKTGGNGGWSTAVVHWRMQYSLRWINRRAYGRASELRTNALALRVALYFCLRWCVVHCLVPPLGIVRVVMRVERSRAAFRATPPPPLPFLSMPPSSRPFVFQFASQVVRYGRHVAPVIATYARAIAIVVTMEILEQTHRIMANMAGRYVSVSSHLGNANVLQGECDIFNSHTGYHRPPQRLGHAPRTGRVCTCCVGLQGGHPPQRCCPLLGENGMFFFFLLKRLLTLCQQQVAGRCYRFENNSGAVPH